MKRLSLLLLIPLMLSGCATLNKNECLTADWITIGYEDGIRGQSPERIGQHRKACADYGISPDLHAYQQGFAQGVVLFCTAHNGYKRGKQGYEYLTFCPDEVESSFRQGYDAGKDVYLASNKRGELLSELEQIEKKQINLQKQISEYENELFSGTSSKEQKKRIYRKINELKEDHYYLSEDYDNLRDTFIDADSNLNKLNNTYREYE